VAPVDFGSGFMFPDRRIFHCEVDNDSQEELLKRISVTRKIYAKNILMLYE